MSSLPAWNLEGILPPCNVQDQTSIERSPYSISLLDFSLRFMSSLERIEILKGFINYRQELHAVGIVSGFQWVNGSFLENTEIIRGVPPKDIDVTTFFYPPQSEKLQKEKSKIFKRNRCQFRLKKSKYLHKKNVPVSLFRKF